MTNEEQRAFTKYAHKAPVNHPGAQRTAARALRVFVQLLTEKELGEISTALSHAVDYANSDRSEFDEVMERIRQRLNGS